MSTPLVLSQNGLYALIIRIHLRIHLLQVMMAANGQQVIVQQQQQPQPQVVQQAQVLSVRAPNGQVVNINQAGTAATAAAAAAPAATVNIPGIGNVQVFPINGV